MVKKRLSQLCGLALAAAMLMAACPGCGDSKPKDETGPRATIKLTSSAFMDGGTIPKKYTRDGDDVSPPLEWSNLPEGTQEIAIIMDDPDARRGLPWVHWVIYKIPPEATSLREAIPQSEKLQEPAGALQGRNSWDAGNIGYRGPSPPSGTHRYFFKIYALSKKLDLKGGMSKGRLLKAMGDNILAWGKLMGKYRKF